MATWPITNKLRKRWRLPVLAGAFFSSGRTSSRVAFNAGSSPARMPVTSDARKVKTNNRQSVPVSDGGAISPGAISL